MLSDGTAWRPLVHVRDVANAALVLLEAPEDAIRGEAFNIGTDEQNYRVRELAEILAGVTGCEVEIAEGSSADNRSYRVDFSRVAAAFPELAFDWNAKLGAQELVDAYRAFGMTREDFDGDRYVRLRRLRTLLDGGALAADLRWLPTTAGEPTAH
jgi:nucleoside-diphosphate-sugar epimerase